MQKLALCKGPLSKVCQSTTVVCFTKWYFQTDRQKKISDNFQNEIKMTDWQNHTCQKNTTLFQNVQLLQALIPAKLSVQVDASIKNTWTDLTQRLINSLNNSVWFSPKNPLLCDKGPPLLYRQGWLDWIFRAFLCHYHRWYRDWMCVCVCVCVCVSVSEREREREMNFNYGHQLVIILFPKNLYIEQFIHQVYYFSLRRFLSNGNFYFYLSYILWDLLYSYLTIDFQFQPLLVRCISAPREYKKWTKPREEIRTQMELINSRETFFIPPLDGYCSVFVCVVCVCVVGGFQWS